MSVKVAVRSTKGILPLQSEKVVFPLYDSLLSETTENINMNKMWPQFNKLDTNNAEIIFYVILHYAVINGIVGQPKIETLPYIKRILDGGKGVLFDASKFPRDLKLLLAKCIEEITK